MLHVCYAVSASGHCIVIIITLNNRVFEMDKVTVYVLCVLYVHIIVCVCIQL